MLVGRSAPLWRPASLRRVTQERLSGPGDRRHTLLLQFPASHASPAQHRAHAEWEHQGMRATGTTLEAGCPLGLQRLGPTMFCKNSKFKDTCSLEEKL